MTYESFSINAPTQLEENGEPISLEVVIYKPCGTGPFPTIMFNHGSTGNGNTPESFKDTFVVPQFAQHFVRKGWLVAFPQRRGRGKSGGLYDEGFEKDRSAYSCNPELSLPGVERALQDLDAAVDYLKNRIDVDSGNMLIVGHSRGGILSIAYAGTRPDAFKGAVNFAGGWMSDRCPNPEAINAVTFRRGAAYRRPTLWLYGENDPFYGIEHSKRNFEEFVQAGGIGTFQTFKVTQWSDGHGLVYFPELWQQHLDAYIDSLH